MSLLSAIVRSSRDYAKPIAQAYASGNRPFTIEVRRPAGGMPTYDRTTNTMTNPEDPLLYRGPGRIHLSSPDTRIEVGEEDTSFISTMISIDTYDGEPPQVDDTVTVVGSADAADAHLTGRVFEVTGVERGGHFDIGWRLDVQGAMPSRHG